MRRIVVPCMVLVASSLFAQGSVDMLKGSSDAGQRAFDQRISPAAKASQAVLVLTEVDVAPVYPGGVDALDKALYLGCDTSEVSTSEECNDDFHYTVRFIVEPDGTATHAEVIGVMHCPILVSSTICGVGQLQRFRPGMVKGAPVRTRMERGFRYTAQ